MNSVEICEAVTQLASEPFDAAEFPYAFLKAFGNKDTTILRLRSGASNASDIPNGVLQRSNIHIATCREGETTRALAALKLSPKTVQAKARFVLTTDGVTFEAEDLQSDAPPVVCAYKDFAEHFGYFLPLAGISTVKQLRESAFDVRATGRLNKLYIELRNINPDWDNADRQHDMNHFMARLIFCFFAEDTDIFQGSGLFTSTVDTMSTSDASNTHAVIETIFRAMNTKVEDRANAKIPSWADKFPYVNGGLFAGNTEVPCFTKLARTYLIHIGSLEWKKINPDIFGSMIQAVADEEERGALGMHYTSVPNILKVLNPLFLDDLRSKLEDAGDNPRTLLNLRKRMARIRVFDPACGSGNFLVIAYKEMRAIEAELNKRRGEEGRATEIPITNFRGIELRDFPAEIARLALIIAEFQCDAIYRGQKEALKEFLPLDTDNWITCANSLQLDWLSVCPPTATNVKYVAEDLFATPIDQAQIDFENEGGETYICGNPPYVGDKKQSVEQKADIEKLFKDKTDRWGSFDYICGFVYKAALYIAADGRSASSLVSTNSISQGMQVAQFWPLIFQYARISSATLSFTWNNLAAKNAGVTCVIIGMESKDSKKTCRIYSEQTVREVDQISPYLTAGAPIYVASQQQPMSDLHPMHLGNFAKDGGNLLLTQDEYDKLEQSERRFIRPIYGAQEFIQGTRRFCIWIEQDKINTALQSKFIKERTKKVEDARLSSPKKATREWAKQPHRFVEIRSPQYQTAIIVPRVSSEERPYLPVGLLPRHSIITEAFGFYDAPLWNLAIVASKMHLVWIATVCGRLRTGFRYSNTLGWNTFPLPSVTDQNKIDLTSCAEDILLARESHFPATIADLYDADNMPDNLRAAHERNDEVLERIYIGRRFRNDTERLEKLFELYTRMISSVPREKVTRKKQKEV